jgi:hypothetical protein
MSDCIPNAKVFASCACHRRFLQGFPPLTGMAGLMPAKATNRIVDDSCVDVERPVVADSCLTRSAVADRGCVKTRVEYAVPEIRPLRSRCNGLAALREG